MNEQEEFEFRLRMEQEQQPGMGDRLLRQGGLALRAGITGATAIPTAGAQLAGGLANAAMGKEVFPNQMQAVQGLMTKAGLPEPGNPTERVVQDAASATAGAGSLLKFLPASLQAHPMLQLGSAASGSGAQSASQESGGSTGGQITAGLLGSFAPGILATAGQRPAQMAGNLLRPLRQAGRDDVKGEVLNKLAGSKRQAIIDALGENRQNVPGTTNTAATAAAPAGSTEFAAAEKMLGSKFAPTQYADLQRTNELARLEATRKVTRDAAGRFAALPRYNSKEAVSAREHVGQQVATMEGLPGKLQNPMGQETPGEFVKAVSNMDMNSLSPNQRRPLQGVQADLLRQQAVRQQAQQGGQGAQEIISSQFATVEPPGTLHRPTMLLRAFLERLQSGTSKQTLSELAQDFQSPQKIQALMLQLPPEERIKFLLMARQMGTASSLGALQQLPQE